MTLYSPDNTSYELEDQPFKSGGEACIYQIKGYPDLVAKIFKPEKRTLTRQKKTTVMSNLIVSSYFRQSVVFPLKVLYADTNYRNYMGYTMEKVQNITELQEIYYQDELDLKQKITVAMNLCIMVNLVHSHNQVIGDFNPRNISFDKTTGKGKLIDTDSFHITIKRNSDNKIQTFPCTVGVESLIAPELKQKLTAQKADLETVQNGSFTQETDLYALGFHIFALIMNGATPYRSCVNIAELGSSYNVSSVNIDVFEAATKGEFLFAKHIYGKKLPEDTPDFNILSSELRQLFERCFIDGASNPSARPTATEYYKALDNFRTQLTKCPKKRHYIYSKYKKPCEYCRIQELYTT